MNTLNGVEQRGDGLIVVQRVYDIRYIFAHVDGGIPLAVAVRRDGYI